MMSNIIQRFISSISKHPDTSKPMNKDQLAKAIEQLKASARDYPEQPMKVKKPEEPYVHYSYDDKDVPLKCSRCGSVFDICTLSPFVYNDYVEIASKYSALGYPCHVRCYCDKCVDAEYPRLDTIVFSFMTSGMDVPVDSFPKYFYGVDGKYDLALRFLQGSRTVADLAGDSERVNAKAIIRSVVEVVGPEPGQNISSAVTRHDIMEHFHKRYYGNK